MTIKEILAGESINVEFKVSRPEKSAKYMKSVIAFANGKGGRIIFGIDDDTRAVVGISENTVFREMAAITNAISDSCEPMIVPDVYPQTIEGKTIIVVEISAGKQKPYYIKADGITDGVYMRVSGTSRKADRTMTQEMYYESEGCSYDTVIRKDLKISEEEIAKFCADMKEVANQETNQETGIDQETSQETNQETDAGKISRDKVICEIKKNPSVTQKKLMEKTGLSRSGVRYIMEQLKKEGILERVGSTKKGQWVIKE